MKSSVRSSVRSSVKSSVRRAIRKAHLSFIYIMILLMITACSNSSSQPNQMQQTTADWEVYTFNELVQKESDLILIATVTAAEQREENTRTVAQEATLAVEEVLSGNVAAKEIVLYQSVDQVSIGRSYLLFLQHRPNIDRYVVVDPNSQIHIEDISAFMENTSTVELKFSDVKGEYTLEEIEQLIK